MRKKKYSRALGGWVLTETLCCAVIVSALAVCVTDSVGMTARAWRMAHESRERALELWSIMAESDSGAAPVTATRGRLVSEVSAVPGSRGMTGVQVSVSDGPDQPPSASWVSWNIKGRSR